MIVEVRVTARMQLAQAPTATAAAAAIPLARGGLRSARHRYTGPRVPDIDQVANRV